MDTATLTYSGLEVPVAFGASLYDLEVEAEVVADDAAPNGFIVVAVSLDALADIPNKGRRWSYVEIGSYHDARYAGAIGPEVHAATPLAKALTAAIATALENNATFAAKARDALRAADDNALGSYSDYRADERREERVA